VEHSRLIRTLVVLVASIAAVLVTGCGTTGASFSPPPPSAGSQLTVNSTTLDFGSMTVGTTSTRTVSATVSGSLKVTISQLGVTGSGFSVSGISLPLTLIPGQSASITVSLDPQTSGSISGSLNILSDATNSSVPVGLTAVAVAPAAPFLSVNPASVNFGSVAVGNSSAKSVVIINSGNASASISQVNVTGAAYNATGLSLPLTLAAGATTSLTLDFAPSVTGTATGNVSLVSTASNSPTNLALTGTGAAAPIAQLTASPMNVAFGNITVGSNGTQSIAISNTGTANLTISQITTSGTGFSGSGLTVPLTLTPGQSANYTAQFVPTSAGSASGQISFVSNASTNPSVALTGTGVAAPAPQLSISPTSLSFGNVNTGSSAVQSIAISNTGNANLTISQITTSGTGFSGSGITVPLTLTPGQNANYTVKFAPASAASASGQVSFASNASTNPTVSLTGTGVAPPTPQLSVSPTSLSFGNVAVGSGSSKSVAISNPGGANLTISQITASGTGFSGSGITVPLTLTPGQSANYTVQFAPGSASSASGQISFTSNASTNPTVTLTGTGVAPPTTTLSVSPTSLSFGNVTVANTASLTETLTASGGSVTVSAAAATGSGYSISGLTLPLTLSAGQSTTFSVLFLPSVTGSSSGSLSFTSNASTGPSPVSLLGTGVAAGSGPTCGKLNDGLVHLPTNYDTFTPPAAGQSYVDPVYGCTVKRLTNGSAETLGDGTHPGLMNFYSTLTAINAGDTTFFAVATDGNWSIRDTSGNIVVPTSNVPGFSGHPVWDAANGNVFYYAQGNSVYSGTISGSSVIGTVLHTFSEYIAVTSMDMADLSQDGDHMALIGQNSNSTMDIFVWSFSQKTKTSIYTTTCTGSVAGAGQPGCLHKLQLTPDNRLTIQFVNEGTGAEQGVRLWTGSTLVHMQDVNTNHYDTGSDLNGNPIFASVVNSTILSSVTSPCPSNWGLDLRQLNNMGSAICLLDNQPYWHVSYRGGASQPWITLSFFDSRTPGPEFFSTDSNYQTISTSNWQLYEDEIILAKVDASKIYRLAHARSRSMESYWAQPHGSISRDGKYILFSSNMAHPNGCPANMHVANDCSDVYMIQIQ